MPVVCDILILIDFEVLHFRGQYRVRLAGRLRQSRARLLVHEPVQALALAITVLHCLALGALLRCPFLPAR
jgi:hypothetical protein